MSSSPESPHLDNHHRNTLARYRAPLIQHNEWHAVTSLLGRDRHGHRPRRQGALITPSVGAERQIVDASCRGQRMSKRSYGLSTSCPHAHSNTPQHTPPPATNPLLTHASQVSARRWSQIGFPATAWALPVGLCGAADAARLGRLVAAAHSIPGGEGQVADVHRLTTPRRLPDHQAPVDVGRTTRPRAPGRRNAAPPGAERPARGQTIEVTKLLPSAKPPAPSARRRRHLGVGHLGDGPSRGRRRWPRSPGARGSTASDWFSMTMPALVNRVPAHLGSGRPSPQRGPHYATDTDRTPGPAAPQAQRGRAM